MHGNFFNITLKNVHNIKATHGNAPSPLRGEGEGSFDINIGNKKTVSFSSRCHFLVHRHPFLRPNLFRLLVLHLYFILPGATHPPPPFSASSFRLPTPSPPPLSTSLHSSSPASTVSSCPLSVFHHPCTVNDIVNDGEMSSVMSTVKVHEARRGEGGVGLREQSHLAGQCSRGGEAGGRQRHEACV